MAEGREREARDGVKIAFGPLLEAEPLESVGSRHHAVDEKRSVVAFDNARLLALDLRQLSGDGFEQIGLRHDSLEHAVFIENGREPDRRLFELLEHPEDRHRFGDDDGLAQRRHDIDLSAGQDLVEQVLLQHHAERLVDPALADQKLLVEAFANLLEDFLLGVPRRRSSRHRRAAS